MKKVPYNKLNHKELINNIVFDKITKKNAVIISEDPLFIKIDIEEEKVEKRNIENLEFYVYEENELKEAKDAAKRLKKILK